MRYDVVAVNIETSAVQIIASNRDEPVADAILTMAVERRGVKDEFFAVVACGRYDNGDKWEGSK